jgi:protein SCO1/2
MLAVSIDLEFDSPKVLRAYGEARLGKTNPFDRLDLATGHRTDVTRLAMFFGLRFEPAAGQISHTLVTAIVGRDGRLLARFPETTWNVDEALAVVERETARGD